MIELRLNRSIYQGECVDEAVKVFAKHGAFELAEEPQHWIVRVSGANPTRERKLAGELGNYALGLTVKRGGV